MTGVGAQIKRLVVLGAALAVLCLTSLPGQALEPSSVRLADLRSKLADLSHQLQHDGWTRTLPRAQLWNALGLSAPDLADMPKAVMAPRPEHTASAEIASFRLALTILSQTYTGQDNLDVERAQPGARTDALSFRGGRVTMADIRDGIARLAPEANGRAIRLPVVLWEDTHLVLTEDDHLEFSRADGAFLISMGRVEVDGARITVSGGPSPMSPDFVPFFTVTGGGALVMQNAHLEGLGFGKTEKFSGLSVAANPLMPRLGPTRIEDTYFEDIETLVISGVPGAVLRNSAFHRTRSSALWFQAAPDGVIEGNLFYGASRTNSIRLLHGSSHLRVQGNMILQGDRAGIVVQGRSDHVALLDNVIWRRDGGAIKLSKTRCSTVRGNVILDSRQKGIEVRGSNGITVDNNSIWSSRNSGIWISAQPKDALTTVTGNSMMGNKAGLTMANGARVRLGGNDFRKQMPRILSGDVAQHSVAVVRDLQGKAPLLLSAAGSRPAPAAGAPMCRDKVF